MPTNNLQTAQEAHWLPEMDCQSLQKRQGLPHLDSRPLAADSTAVPQQGTLAHWSPLSYVLHLDTLASRARSLRLLQPYVRVSCVAAARHPALPSHPASSVQEALVHELPVGRALAQQLLTRRPCISITLKGGVLASLYFEHKRYLYHADSRSTAMLKLTRFDEIAGTPTAPDCVGVNSVGKPKCCATCGSQGLHVGLRVALKGAGP